MRYIFDTSNYFKHQSEWFKSTAKLKALVSGYGAGKSYVFLRETLKNHLNLKTKDGLSNGWILYPTYDLAEEIFVDPFQQLLEDYDISYDYNVQKHLFKTKFGRIKIYQLQKPTRIVGSNLTFVGADEFDVESEKNCHIAFTKSLARLRGNSFAPFYLVTTPEGFKETYKIFSDTDNKKGKLLVQAKTTDNPTLPPEYIDTLLENYDPKLVKQYMDGQFVNITQGQVYYMFDRQLNHTSMIHNVNLPIRLCVDFNVNPMIWEIAQVEYDKINFVDEIKKNNTNTIEMAQAVADKYGKFTKFIVYGDYSGNNKDTRSLTTDYEIIQQILPNTELRIKPHPSISDKVNSVNALLCNAKGLRRMFVNTKRCPELTKDLEQNVYKEGKHEIDKDDLSRTHASDGAGYFVEYEYSIRGAIKLKKGRYA